VPMGNALGANAFTPSLCRVVLRGRGGYKDSVGGGKNF